MVIFSSRPPPMVLVIYADGDGEAYVRYLTTAGFRAVSVSRNPTGEIVDRTLATMPDVIVLDYDCDGETLEQLKGDRRTAAIPVIALAELPIPGCRPGFADNARPGPDGSLVVRE
jgi:CheY-like chemotaxis protein